MLNVLIVTDSSASFPDRSTLSSPNLHVIPSRIKLGDQVLLEGVDIPTREVWEKIRGGSPKPVVEPPSALDFYKVFQAASKRYDGILSIHASAALSDSFRNAQAAADRISGRCEVAQIDSQSLCVGQALLAAEALRLLGSVSSFDELERGVRTQTARLFAIYYVESTEALLHNDIVSAEHSVLSAMLGVKPLLTIDDGKVVTTGKARTRAQIVDQLVEFAQGFVAFDAAVVIQPDLAQRSETTRALLNRLTETFPGKSFTLSGYSPAMASILGQHAGGLVILGSRLGEEHGSYED
ncbi:MAG: DegV family EDD domain-containing protein [Anaerolineae bacterium]|nr:DegV family EDD domain-containing protein [Chloroflexota bacterium]MBP6297938.1 DegV family EDD domain-containing protein [Anaerolineae bacterium]